ncbi:MAG TPA: ABC transporter substrate-binding protein [Bacillales bacterium]|nr:ABC transporter substrate-binding protein [Bacillales bacterium]
MRKTFMLVLTLFMGLSLFLAACSSEKSSGGSGNDGSEGSSNSGDEGNGDGGMSEVTLNVTTTFGGTDPGHDAYEKLVSQFEEEHPNVTIKENNFTAKPATTAKFRTSWSGGKVPDVLWYFVGAKGNFLYESGKTVPMPTIMEANPEWADTFDQRALEAVKKLAPNGKLHAIPLLGYYEGLIANKALFEKYGLELPKTWEAFKKAVETFKKNDVIPVTVSMNTPNYLIEHYILAAGGAKCHSKGLEEGVPECYVNGLNLIKETYEWGAYPEDSLTLPDDVAAQNYYKKGQAAMIFDGSWVVGGLPEDIAKTTTVLPVPTPPNSSGYDGKQIISGFSQGWFVSKEAYNSNKKKAAVAFLKFMTSKEADQALVDVYGSVPAVKGVEVKAGTPAQMAGFDLVENATALEPASDGFLPPKTFAHIRDNIPAIVTGEKTAEGVLKKAKELGY